MTLLSSRLLRTVSLSLSGTVDISRGCISGGRFGTSRTPSAGCQGPADTSHIIQVHQAGFVSNSPQDGFHQALERCQCHAKAKGHKSKLLQCLTGREHCHLLVPGVQGKLPVTALQIWGKKLFSTANVSRMSYILVAGAVSLWKVIQRSVVHTQLKVSVLPDENDGWKCRIVRLLDYPSSFHIFHNFVHLRMLD
jgi:hypothetical protein